MNEKSEAVRQSYIRLLAEDQEFGHLYAEDWVVERLQKLPELQMVDYVAMILSGELAGRSDHSRFELGEAKCIADLLIGYADRLNEIGQENESYDGLVAIGSVLEAVGKSIKSLIDHHANNGRYSA